MRVRVTTAHVSQHGHMRLYAGDSLAVGHRNTLHPEFVWCATDDGRAGWAPEALLDTTEPGCAVIQRDYDASHLTAAKGEVLTALERVGDWLFCENASGHAGWVHTDALEEVAGD